MTDQKFRVKTRYPAAEDVNPPEHAAFYAGDVVVPAFKLLIYDLNGPSRHVADEFEKSGPCTLCETPPTFFAKIALLSEQLDPPSRYALGICLTCATRHGSGLADAVKEYWIGYCREGWRLAWDRAEQAARWDGGHSIQPFELRIVDMREVEMPTMRCLVCGQPRPAAKLALSRDLASDQEALAGICSPCAAQYGIGLADQVVRIAIDWVELRKN